jgi:hypothetical protein
MMQRRWQMAIQAICSWSYLGRKKMRQHDPYGPMLEELRRINDADTDELFHDSLHQAQQYVTNLRIAYEDSPSNVDFSCPHTRAAYLLAYYPNLIEPLYEILCGLSPEVVHHVFGREKVRGLFLGAGPAPEVIGWIAFLNDYVPEVRIATAYLLDKYIHGWRTGQEITRYHLAPNYWLHGQIAIMPMEFDFLAPETLTNPFVQRSIQISDLVVMQNCLNDQLGNCQAVMIMLQNVFTQITPGTLFVVSDINYNTIRDTIREFSDFVARSGLGEVLLPVQDQAIRIRPHIEVPQVLLEHLLTRDAQRRLIPRKYTYFYSAVYRRIEEIPF